MLVYKLGEPFYSLQVPIRQLMFLVSNITSEMNKSVIGPQNPLISMTVLFGRYTPILSYVQYKPMWLL